MLFFCPMSLQLVCFEGVLCRKSEILWTRKSRSFRLAKRKVILLRVLMESGLGKILELSAFSTIVTYGIGRGINGVYKDMHLVSITPENYLFNQWSKYILRLKTKILLSSRKSFKLNPITNCWPLKIIHYQKQLLTSLSGIMRWHASSALLAKQI